MTTGTWPCTLLWKLGFQFPITSFFWKKIPRTVEDEVMLGQACGAVCVCVGKIPGLLLPLMPHLTWHPSVDHMIVSLFIGPGQGNVCHPGSCGEEPILQKAPNPSEACHGTTNQWWSQEQTLVNLVSNEAKLFSASASGVSLENSGCLPRVCQGPLCSSWAAPGCRLRRRPWWTQPVQALSSLFRLSNSNHMALRRPCHARRAWVLFLSSKISD